MDIDHVGRDLSSDALEPRAGEAERCRRRRAGNDRDDEQRRVTDDQLAAESHELLTLRG